jgi:hypothetical protein
MKIKKDYDFNDLKTNSWSGAINTLETIEENEKEEELMQLLELTFEDVPTETEVNDFLWFDDDFIFEELGIKEEE